MVQLQLESQQEWPTSHSLNSRSLESAASPGYMTPLSGVILCSHQVPLAQGSHADTERCDGLIQHHLEGKNQCLKVTIPVPASHPGNQSGHMAATDPQEEKRKRETEAGRREPYQATSVMNTAKNYTPCVWQTQQSDPREPVGSSHEMGNEMLWTKQTMVPAPFPRTWHSSSRMR